MKNQIASDQWNLLAPFWKSNTAYGESLFFIQDGLQDPPASLLLFIPRQITRLCSASHQVVYQEGQDYCLDPGSQRIWLPTGSRIPYVHRPELYRTPGQDFAIGHLRGDESTWLYFSEGHYFHDLQVEATYTHQDSWTGFVPTWQGDQLVKTMKKLRAGQPLSVCLAGDSISAGANASKLTGVEPYQPAYGELFAESLSRYYRSQVVFKNFAVGGEGAAHALRMAPQVTAAQPDLVVIAYGMNDVNQRDPQAYQQRIASAIEALRQTCPNAEFILVASMLGNPRWAFTPVEMFPLYRDALNSLCGAGVVLANMTSVWSDLLKIKSYYDLTGNGVNHPNDFGHRLYAQVLLSTLLEPVVPPG